VARYSSVEELRADHSLEGFDCGSDAQTIWLREHALQSHRSHDSHVPIVRRLEDDRVVGFYALRTGSILREEAPIRLTKGAGSYAEIGVVILTRLGVDLSEQGEGLGRALVVDAFRVILRLAEEVGFRALLIHAEDDTARNFYLRLANFEESPVDPLQLTLTIKDLRKAANG
jgi:GNAT superfamily N-acetyltransferase